jgi:hypothetical protein
VSKWEREKEKGGRMEKDVSRSGSYPNNRQIRVVILSNGNKVILVDVEGEERVATRYA